MQPQINQRDFMPSVMAQDTLESLFAAHGPRRPIIYWLLLVSMVGAIAALPLIQVDVAVRAIGWVRPAAERTEIRPAVSGHIEHVLARDNDRVRIGQALLTLDSGDIDERIARNRALQQEEEDLLSDLVALTRSGGIGSDGQSLAPISDLRTPALQQDRAQFFMQASSYRLAVTKAQNELRRYNILADKGLVAERDRDNAGFEAERLQRETNLLVEQALARWQFRLRDERSKLADLVSEGQRLREAQAQYTVRSTSDGSLIGFSGLSAGAFVTAGQALGTVSPNDTLLIETFVSPRDVGLMRVGQDARLQIDAYSYTQWGTLVGVVESISGDTTSYPMASQASPYGNAAFKVVVRPRSTTLRLANGVRGDLRKGMTLSARFLVARRSLLSVLYEDVSSWLDPKARSA
jgi:multidrug resistance efflux pump